MRLFSKPNLIIAAAGLIGAASLVAMPMASLVPADLRDEIQALNPLLFVIQPVLLVLAACAAGGLLAGRIGLGAPLIEAMVRGRVPARALRRAVAGGLLAGFLAALVLWAYAIAAPAPSVEIPIATRILYGGITEEVIARYGVMTVAVWLSSRLAGLNPVVYVTGAAIAAIVFAAGHLPLLFTLAPTASASLIGFVLAANFIVGLGFGLLYWRRGLETAMIAHASAHVFAAAFSAAV